MLKRLTVKKILKYVGTFNNIESFTNCGTRLRITVKNTAIVKYESINELKSVKGIIMKGENLEIVFGMDTIKYADAMEKLMA